MSSTIALNAEFERIIKMYNLTQHIYFPNSLFAVDLVITIEFKSEMVYPYLQQERVR